ncbi:hypothetical protein M8C21_006753 [Ambrosia artemisiifolia]|uniref:Uncharacterized protein n=1 Tax=Ambrosia artemisiifolia TaxID=4212 RepID=A0AAD5D8B3_AMBAR|nr:hypothetical protein M8C21_006753 [Ambrosia artemisiifolia]
MGLPFGKRKQVDGYQHYLESWQCVVTRWLMLCWRFLRRFRTTGMWLELHLRPDIDDSVWFRLHSRVFVCRNLFADTNAFERHCIRYLGLQRAQTPPPPVGHKVLP